MVTMPPSYSRRLQKSTNGLEADPYMRDLVAWITEISKNIGLADIGLNTANSGQQGTLQRLGQQIGDLRQTQALLPVVGAEFESIVGGSLASQLTANNTFQTVLSVNLPVPEGKANALVNIIGYGQNVDSTGFTFIESRIVVDSSEISPVIGASKDAGAGVTNNVFSSAFAVELSGVTNSILIELQILAGNRTPFTVYPQNLAALSVLGVFTE
jgi:hypothetical protein